MKRTKQLVEQALDFWENKQEHFRERFGEDWNEDCNILRDHLVVLDALQNALEKIDPECKIEPEAHMGGVADMVEQVIRLLQDERVSKLGE